MLPTPPDRGRRSPDRAQTSLGMQCCGLVALAVGLGLWQVWVGVVAFGAGLLILGVGYELG